MIQDNIFKISEADNWFLRNKDSIINKNIENDYPYCFIKNLKSKNKINSVLELGASNGYRLNALRKILPDCNHLQEENVYTYKIDYAKVFESLNTYQIITKKVFNHDNNDIEETNSSNRAFTTLLRKDLYGYYNEI